MYQLYYFPGACSMAVHVVLNELNQPVELIDAKNNPANKEKLLAVNPRGQVPTLVDDGQVIREGGAIISYLLDKHNSPLLPKSGKERATALEWLMFANATLHPAYGRIFFINRNTSDAAAKEQLLDLAMANINKLWAEIDARLTKTPYICGNDITGADILICVIANWQAWLPKPATIGPNVKRMLAAVSTRPAYQKALADEKVEYKAAA